jgi:hypothetical protein
VLTRGDGRIDDQLHGFLARAYNLKAVEDYETGAGSIIPLERVEVAITDAIRFIDAVTRFADGVAHVIRVVSQSYP